MALKPCIECAKPISTQAKVCPNCDRAEPHNERLYQKLCGAVVILGLCAYTLFRIKFA